MDMGKGIGRRLLLALALVATGVSGCAGIGVWSPQAKTDITKFTTWSDQYIGGALKSAPVVIAEASQLKGVPASDIAAANAALATAKGVMSTIDSLGGAASGNTAAANEAAVLQAIANVNTTVGNVKAAVQAASGEGTSALPGSSGN
jgi:hypothetical protein